MLPSGEDHGNRDVNEEEEGEMEMEHRSEEEWEMWEFEEDEEDDYDDGDEEDEEEEEEEEGEGGASVPTDLCLVCVTTPHNASIIHGDTGHQVCCFECTSRLKMEKKTCPVCHKKIKL